jgi:hypothetical protein
LDYCFFWFTLSLKNKVVIEIKNSFFDYKDNKKVCKKV